MEVPDLSKFLKFSEDPNGHPIADLYRIEMDSAIAAALERGYAVRSEPSRAFFWQVFYSPRSDHLPQWGWKIHISYAPVDICTKFPHVLTWLIRSHVTFKLPATLRGLIWINAGGIGLQQVGKVVTIYCEHREHCELIIHALQDVVTPTSGPQVATDFQVEGGHGLSVRFGAFSNSEPEPDDFGRYRTYIVDRDGRRVPDRREDTGSFRAKVPNRPAGLITTRKPAASRPRRIKGQQYILLSNLHTSPKGNVYLACNVQSLATCIVKWAKPGVFSDPNGFDAAARLKNEYLTLTALSGHGKLPTPIAYDENANILVLEDLGGVAALFLSKARQIFSLIKLFDEIQRLHKAGFVHRDIKLSNILVAGRKVFLTDFELCQKEGETKPIVGGTRNYGRDDNTSLAVSRLEDLFAFGMTIVHAFFASDPALHAAGAGRFIGLLSLFAPPQISNLVRDLIDETRARSVTSAKVCTVLSGAAANGGRISRRPDRRHLGRRRLVAWARRAVPSVATATLAYFKPSSAVREEGSWINQHSQPDFACEGIDSGSAGCILGLSIIADIFGYAALDRYICAGARWLSSNPPPKYSAGLLTGNAGVAISLAVASRRLGMPSFLEAAQSRLWTAARFVRENDFYAGAAGVVLAGCLMSELGLVRDCDRIVWPLTKKLRNRAQRKDNLTLWQNTGRLDKSKDRFLGAAHGAAGIGAALGRYGRLVGDEDLCCFAKEAIWSVYRGGKNSDMLSLRYTLESAEVKIDNTMWCHGNAGFVHSILLGFGDDPDLREPLDWATRQFLRDCARQPITNVTMCHGLAGRLELLRMLTDIRRYQRVATELAELTARTLRLLSERRAGCVVWPSEDSHVFTPDLWIGFLGPAVQLGLWLRNDRHSLFSSQVLAGAYRP